MLPNTKPRVFLDADALLAACASPSEHGASLVVLRMAEITLIEACTCPQVIDEVRRNLADKLPRALPLFEAIVMRCLQVAPNPSADEIAPYQGLADAKDLGIFVAALQANCRWLVTFNTRHFQPGHRQVAVVRPGELLSQVRDLLAHLG
jgi:hypothetical protein